VELQRAGLFYGNGMVYVGFGSHCDIGAWRGFVMAVKSVARRNAVGLDADRRMAAAPDLAPAAVSCHDGNDANGNPRVFLATGNGTSPPERARQQSVAAPRRCGRPDRAEFRRSARADDFFAPENAPDLSVGTRTRVRRAAALPDSFDATHPHLLVEGWQGRSGLPCSTAIGSAVGGRVRHHRSTVQTVGRTKGIWDIPRCMR